MTAGNESRRGTLIPALRMAMNLVDESEKDLLRIAKSLSECQQMSASLMADCEGYRLEAAYQKALIIRLWLAYCGVVDTISSSDADYCEAVMSANKVLYD